MPSLIQSLHDRDLGHLRIVAELWGLELTASQFDQACEQLAAALLDPALVEEVIESLPAAGRTALETLVAQGGRMPWVRFARRFGEVREMGAGRRDREQPHLRPESAAEMLFYRALLARAFFDTPDGAQEFAYLPDDLLKIINKQEVEKGLAVSETNPKEPLGRPATQAERARPLPATDHILDDATTLLAALRLGIDPPSLAIPLRFLLDLLSVAGLIGDSTPLPDPVKAFLEAPRAESLTWLSKAWLDSETFNELHQLPDLICEGKWKNDPLKTRQILLSLLSAAPAGKWWSLAAFTNAVKQLQPDFQRPAGDYDSWFIRRKVDGEYLRGFEHWEQVDGALVRYFISGPLHWLGMIDLARPESEDRPTAFRLTSHFSFLRAGKSLSDLPAEEDHLHVSSQGRICVPRLVPRAVRYQVARFCEWEPAKADQYRYRLTPACLERAQQAGLKIEYLLSLLKNHAAAQVPPSLVRALRRWEVNGTEARVEDQIVLRLNSPEVLERLRKSKAARFLGEPLGPTAVIVKPGAQSKVLAALAEMDILAEDQTKEADSQA